LLLQQLLPALPEIQLLLLQVTAAVQAAQLCWLVLWL
jgi:hypothetical protein